MKTIISCITELPYDSFWLPISLKGFLEVADKIVIVDGSQSPSLMNALLKKNNIPKDKLVIIHKMYPHDNKGADGIMRNQYLNYCKQHFIGDLCVVVDSDEVLSDDCREQLEGIKEVMQRLSVDIFNPQMIHFIDNFSRIDATQPVHYCPGRIFKISSDLSYPEVEHVLIESKERDLKFTQDVDIKTLYYHYGYTKSKELIIQKYNKHLLKSNIHTPSFLKMWKDAHLLGTYPSKLFEGRHPGIVREVFKLD